MADETLGVSIDGLNKLRRDLRAMDKALPRELAQDMKKAVEDIVLPAARGYAPRRSGRLAGSLRVSGGGRTLGIRSSLPYANFIYWGGSVGRGHMPRRPWSGSITRNRRELRVGGQFIKAATPFIHKAYETRGERFYAELGETFVRFARRHGF